MYVAFSLSASAGHFCAHPLWATSTNFNPGVRQGVGIGRRVDQQRLDGSAIIGLEPSVVDRVRDEATELRMHTARDRQEDALGRRNCRLLPHQVLQRRQAGTTRMVALDRLSQLHLVADQHDVSGADAHGDGVGQADLARLVNEEVVEAAVKLGPGEQEGRSGDQLETALGGLPVVQGVHNEARRGQHLVLAAGLLHPAEFQPLFGRDGLDGGQQAVDRLVRMRDHADGLAGG